MAQAIVQSLCRKLRSAIAVGDKDTGDLQEIMETLEVIHPLLEDAEMRYLRFKLDVPKEKSEEMDTPEAIQPLLEGTPQQMEGEKVRDWLRRVVKAAYDILDVLQDTMTLAAPARKMMKMIPRANASEKKNLMAGEMEKLKEEVCRLQVDMGEFNLMPSDSEASLEQPVIDAAVAEEPMIVGRDEEIEWIVESISVEEWRCFTVQIDGRGGSGKTTLARMVFNHTRFKNYSRVWIQCSGNFHLKEIGKAIIFHVSGEEINTGSNDNMAYVKKRLHQLLDNSIEVLVVLDDILLDDAEQLVGMLTEGDNDSEVILVTVGDKELYLPKTDSTDFFRNISLSCSALSDDICWTIIKQRSRFEGRSLDKQELEPVGTEIAKKCHGSPLAAALLGGMLLYKDATGWAEVLKSDVWAYDCFYEPFLMLAYTSMPPSLRLCFIYFAMFQNGHTIAKDDLIYQWTSLGLIEQSDRFSAIQLGEQYISMLLGMSLLQTTMPVSTSGNADESTTTWFTVNHMVHDLAEQVMCDVYDATETSYQPELCSNKDRRYVLLTDLKLSSKLSAQVRALRCVGSGKMELRNDSFSFSKCLRVLDLNDSSMQNLPNSVSQLRHLGYLNLSGCSDLVILPESLGDLLNLLYLDLSGCSRLRNLPESVGKLINLAHIELWGCSRLVNLSESFGKLINLLHVDLSRCYGLINLPDSFGKLTNLLHVDLSRCSGLINLPDSFGKLTSLKDIDLSGCSGLEKLPQSFGKLTSCKHIDLLGCSGLEKLPQSFGKLTNLVYINLSRCSGLVSLPPSFRKLIYLLHINLSGCSGLVNLLKSFGDLISLVHINLSGCCGLLNLPESFGNLKNLLHVDLSRCYGLINLPDSFGKLTNLLHVDLSRCSGLINLPDSFGKLTSLEHIDLSGCSGLEKLPQSFGKLKNLLHVDLSCCYGLGKLPESFSKLKNLLHLDLSFWSCFEGIGKALGGLTNLQHLNLSHPCCYLAQQQSCLKDLKDVLSQLTKLEYLNLSMFLNPIFYSESVERTLEFIQCISVFSSLEHLDLSYNRFLHELPESLGELNNLQTLELSGCIRLKSIAKRIGEIKSLKSINVRNCRSLKSCQVVVNVDNGAYISRNIFPLKNANLEEVEISCLENVKSIGDACEIRSVVIGKAQKSKLCWTTDSQGSMEVNTLLRELLPPHLQCLELHGYSGETRFSAWCKSTRVPTLVEVTIEDMPRCSHLPPLCLLPNLRRAVFRRMASITRFDVNDLTDGNRKALHRLPKFTLELDDMENLKELKTTYSRNGKESMLPAIGELVIMKCPRLCFGPFMPRARRLVISDCSELMVYSRGGHSVESPCIPVSINELVVKNCKVALYNWNLLHNLPGLHSLTVKDCGDLSILPDTIDALSSLQSLCLSNCDMYPLKQHLGDLTSLRELKIVSCKGFDGCMQSLQRLTSLGSMHLSDCSSITSLPEWLGDFTNLEKLAIHRCPAIESLPGSINKLTNMKDLHILDCPKLKSWCEREDNKKIMAHIRTNYEEHGTSRPGSKDESDMEGDMKDWSDGVDKEEEEAEAVSTDSMENSVVSGNFIEEEEAEAVSTDSMENSVVSGKVIEEEEEEEEETGAASTDAMENSVVSGNADVVEEEVVLMDAVENSVVTDSADVVREEVVLTDVVENSVVTDNADVVEEPKEAGAVLTDAMENSVLTDSADAVEEEVTRDVDAAAAADVCLELRLGLPSNEEVAVAEQDEISLRLYL